MHESAKGCMRGHCGNECGQSATRVHLDHGRALQSERSGSGTWIVHLDHGSALQCQRVHLDRWSALGSWECTGVESSVE